MAKNIHGGRVVPVTEATELAVINKSNRDVQVNDCQEPFSLVVLTAGDYDPDNWRTNCVQFFHAESAQSLVAQAPNSLEVASKANGVRFLQRAQQFRSFEKAYREMRGGALVDMSKHPAEVATRNLLVKNLLRTGLSDRDIPESATNAELQAMLGTRNAGRQNLQLVEFTTPAPSEHGAMGGRVVPPFAEEVEAEADAQSLRDRITELGGTFKPTWKIEYLQRQVAFLEAKAEAAAQEAAQSA